jgi:hypothetical protein
MAQKTNSEKIDDLEKIVAVLSERLDSTRQEKVGKDEFAVVKERLGFAFLPPLVAGIIGAVLTLFVQYLLKK